MATVMLFHHVRGLTDDVESFADDLRSGGHRVITPDLYDGRTFADLDAGVTHVDAVGLDEILRAASVAAEGLPAGVVYAGFSLGALCAHRLVQTRSDASGALLYHHGDVPMTTFAHSWPAGVDLQIHVAEDDPFHEPEITRDFVASVGSDAELFLYPGSGHLFCDPASRGYDASARALVLDRSLELLDRHG